MAFEEEFSIEVLDEEAEQCLTVRNVIDLIVSKVREW
jgi:acyl carrier protein